MQVTNRKQYDSMQFAEYTKLPGIGFSGLRNPDGFVQPTAKMRFGSLVDDYLFTPSAYSGEQRDLVVPVALELRRILGKAIDYGKPQLSVTADFIHDGFTLAYRGRLDLYLKGLVVDLKVSELDPRKAVEYFRYDWQLSGYCAATDSAKAILCSIHPRTRKVSLLPITPIYDWWHVQIITHGTPNI